MVAAAISDKMVPMRWIMLADGIETLRALDVRDGLHLDAPRLVDLDPPMFMGLPIMIGSPGDGEPDVQLVTVERATSR